MEYFGEGSPDDVITDQHAGRLIDQMLAQLGDPQRVLLLPPDGTRAASGAADAREELVDPSFALDADGFLPVPNGPGLGIEIDRDRLEQFRKDGFESETWLWDQYGTFEAK